MQTAWGLRQSELHKGLTVTKVLIVEDDAQIAKSLSINLSLDGYEVHAVSSIGQAWSDISLKTFDILLLDVNLPDGSGLELCQRVRASGKTVPILFLSARTDEESVVKGISFGADDYIRKPFGNAELKARMKRILQKTSDPGRILEAGPLTLDLEQHTATLLGRGLSLGNREFEILALLVRRGRDVTTRESILRALDENSEAYDRTIDSHISHLRKKMRDAGGDRVQIISIYGVGYRLEWFK